MPRTWRFHKVFCLFSGPRYHPYQFINWPLYSWAGEGKAEKVGGSRDYRFAWSPSFGRNFFFSNVYVPSLHYLLINWVLDNRLNFLQICTIFVLQCCFLYIFVASTYFVRPRLKVSTFQQNSEFKRLEKFTDLSMYFFLEM